MSSLSELTTTFESWTVEVVASATATVTQDPVPYLTTTLQQGYTSGSATANLVVHGSYRMLDLPLTCDAIYELDVSNHTRWGSEWADIGFVPLEPNPDIAGLGVRFFSLEMSDDREVLMQQQIILSFLITAFLVLLLAIIAYAGGFLPGRHLRRVDRCVLHANSRNEESKWREIIEDVTLSLSDQQLVTGLAILIAGYYEMLNNNLSVYHWNIVVYLAWMSSAVHIASLTLLQNVFTEQRTLRNIRVAGMTTLFVLLTTAMWPLRRTAVPLGTPAKCLWVSRPWSVHLESDKATKLNPDRILSVIMLFASFTWKMSQLFSSSRGWVRRWLVAEPQAATERLMRRALLSQRPKSLTRPVYLFLAYFYIVAAVYPEMTESFAAVIVYLCIALPWGTFCIFRDRKGVSDDVKAGEATLTFGQLVPLFLLVLPALAAINIYGLSAGECNVSDALYVY